MEAVLWAAERQEGCEKIVGVQSAAGCLPPGLGRPAQGILASQRCRVDKTGGRNWLLWQALQAVSSPLWQACHLPTLTSRSRLR